MRRAMAAALLSLAPLLGCSDGVVGPNPAADDSRAAPAEAVDFAPVAALARDALLHDLVASVQNPELQSALSTTLADLGAAAEARDPVEVSRAATGHALAVYAKVEGLGHADQQTLGALQHALGHVRWLIDDPAAAP